MIEDPDPGPDSGPEGRMLSSPDELEFSPNSSQHELSELSALELSEEVGPKDKSLLCLPEKSGYRDTVYVKAAHIFQGIRLDKAPDKVVLRYGEEPPIDLPDFEDETNLRLSYELAFSALKYQDILENILIDSCFYPNVSIPDALTSLVVVMLYDFQDRKFQSRLITDVEQSISEVQEVENLLNSFKTKLAAALARCRIKHDALSIYHILPETVRKQEQRASTLPLYAWVNTCKISPEGICDDLKKEGYTKVKSALDFDCKSFCMDQHCSDVIIFPSHLKSELLNIELCTGYKLLFQDKSRSLAVHSVKTLLNMDDDILLVNMGSWYTVAHMSTLTNQNTSKIYVCGVKAQTKESELQDLFSNMGCRNIEVLNENFTDIEAKDQRLQKVKVILLLPRCSGLGVSNPIEFILNENEDADLLKDHSQGAIAKDKLHVLAEQQYEQLKHAMQFSKAQAIVYCTCSVYPEENEVVVKKALELGVEGNKVQPYRLSPPVLPLCSAKEIHSSIDKFFKVEPSEITNGCFLAVLTRERDPSETVSVKDVLARAAAKGLLDGIELAKTSKREKKKKKSKTSLVKPSTNEGMSTQIKIAEFLSREMKPHAKISSETLTAKVPASQKSTAPSSSPPQKKLVKMPPNALVPSLMKNLPSTSKGFERQMITVRPRPEDKMVALKPVEIVLPPVMVTYSGAQANKSQIPAPQFYYRWIGGI
ncbi:putative methyltransferase NSUN7 isoform X2 [Sarcophilus harrisii]|uniref:NOP2/Sun RNA methyltransferase family member 7 n=1 Tax=Sarcophilus harrisii TaxID=9305 RepID=G3WY63_SARHA|nr:putative methyltransferase NSUN7 isoform X2 [Sarcophilus harrisii]